MRATQSSRPVREATSRAAAFALVLALVLAPVLATVGACGAGVTPVTPDLSVLPPDLVLADLKDPGYPAGPFAQAGNVNPGDVLPDFTFHGYWSPNATTGKASSQTFGEVTFGMLHASGARYAIINLSAFW